MRVELPDLEDLQPQLQRLELRVCILQGAAAIFAHSWAKLEVLKLEGCTIDADLGAIKLPRLTHLTLSGNKLAGGLYECTALCGQGCPQCIYVFVGPCLAPADSSPAASYRGFRSLQSVEMSWDPARLRDWGAWPGPVPELDLPATVGSLTCRNLTYHDLICALSTVTRYKTLDMFSFLAMAGRIISRGGQLSKLCLGGCATAVCKLTGGDGREEYLEPSEQELASVYRPVCRSLHGLTVLDLCRSYQCGLQAVAEVVRSAPDLVDLRLCVPFPTLWRKSSSTITCAGLRHLRLSCDLDARIRGKLVDLEYVLEDSRSLDSITVRLKGELLRQDIFTMHLTCRAGAVIRCIVDLFPDDFAQELRVMVEAAPGHLPARRALVSFCWDADEGWVSSVSYS